MTTFTCEKCDLVFEKAWSDDEARNEYDRNFPEVANLPADQLGLVCDNCYKAFNAWFASLSQSERDQMAVDAWADAERSKS